MKRRVNDKEEKCKWAADGLRAQMKNVFCVVGLQVKRPNKLSVFCCKPSKVSKELVMLTIVLESQ